MRLSTLTLLVCALLAFAPSGRADTTISALPLTTNTAGGDQILLNSLSGSTFTTKRAALSNAIPDGTITTNKLDANTYLILTSGGSSSNVFFLSSSNIAWGTTGGSNVAYVTAVPASVTNQWRTDISSSVGYLSTNSEVVVSGRGIANHMSSVTNDGYQYGPDTPGTTTGGFQEAWTRSLAGEPFYGPVPAAVSIRIEGMVYFTNALMLSNQWTTAVSIKGNNPIHDMLVYAGSNGGISTITFKGGSYPAGATLLLPLDIRLKGFGVTAINNNTNILLRMTNYSHASLQDMNFTSWMARTNQNWGAGTSIVGDGQIPRASDLVGVLLGNGGENGTIFDNCNFGHLAVGVHFSGDHLYMKNNTFSLISFGELEANAGFLNRWPSGSPYSIGAAIMGYCQINCKLDNSYFYDVKCDTYWETQSGVDHPNVYFSHVYTETGDLLVAANYTNRLRVFVDALPAGSYTRRATNDGGWQLVGPSTMDLKRMMYENNRNNAADKWNLIYANKMELSGDAYYGNAFGLSNYSASVWAGANRILQPIPHVSKSTNQLFITGSGTLNMDGYWSWNSTKHSYTNPAVAGTAAISEQILSPGINRITFTNATHNNIAGFDYVLTSYQYDLTNIVNRTWADVDDNIPGIYGFFCGPTNETALTYGKLDRLQIMGSYLYGLGGPKADDVTMYYLGNSGVSLELPDASTNQGRFLFVHNPPGISNTLITTFANTPGQTINGLSGLSLYGPGSSVILHCFNTNWSTFALRDSMTNFFDVSVSGLASGDHLAYNGANGKWTNGPSSATSGNGSASNAVTQIQTNGVTLATGVTNLNFNGGTGVTIVGTNLGGSAGITIGIDGLTSGNNYLASYSESLNYTTNHPAPWEQTGPNSWVLTNRAINFTAPSNGLYALQFSCSQNYSNPPWAPSANPENADGATAVVLWKNSIYNTNESRKLFDIVDGNNNSEFASVNIVVSPDSWNKYVGGVVNFYLYTGQVLTVSNLYYQSMETDADSYMNTRVNYFVTPAASSLSASFGGGGGGGPYAGYLTNGSGQITVDGNSMMMSNTINRTLDWDSQLLYRDNSTITLDWFTRVLWGDWIVTNLTVYGTLSGVTATQTEVNQGIVTNKYVSPYTLANRILTQTGNTNTLQVSGAGTPVADGVYSWYPSANTYTNGVSYDGYRIYLSLGIWRLAGGDPAFEKYTNTAANPWLGTWYPKIGVGGGAAPAPTVSIIGNTVMASALGSSSDSSATAKFLREDSVWSSDGAGLTNINGLSVGVSNWVTSLASSVNRHFYFSSVTNGIAAATNCSSMIDVPVATASTNSIAVQGIGEYFLSRLSTNTISRLDAGPIDLQTYVFITGGGGVQSVTAHPEIYLWFTNGTTQQVASGADQVFTEGSGIPVIFNISMSVATGTNLPVGTKLLLRWKATAAANTPTWNFCIGGDYDSHISVNTPAQGGTYIGTFIGEGGGLTNLNASSLASGTIPYSSSGSLTNHTDVTITSLTSADHLAYNGATGKWTNGPSGGGSAVNPAVRNTYNGTFIGDGSGLTNLPASGGGFTNMAVSIITYGTTITPDLSIANIVTYSTTPRRLTYRCTLTGNITTVAAPTGTAVDGDEMIWEMIQDATGSRTIAGFNAVYGFGDDITGLTLTTTASKRDFVVWKYNSTAAKWYCTGFMRGY